MLLNTITEIQNHLVIGNGTDFNRVKPHISNAETAYMRPLLGSDMFDELQEFYDELPSANDELTEVQEAMKELLGKVQKSIIHLAYWMGFAVLNAHISDGGFKRSESATVKSLLKSQEDDLKEYFKDAGFNAMDEVLEYIELNIAHFNEYKLSPNWSIFKSAFIPDTKIFNAIIDIKSSRLTFLRLKSYSVLVEDMEIRPILGTVIFEEVKAAMVLDEPVAKVSALLNYIRKPIAYLSTAMLMEESGADLTEKGLYFESTTATTISGKNKQPANADRIAQLASSYRNNGNSYLDQLKSYLAANATDWPTYSGQTGSVFRRDNTGKKTFFA